MNIRKPHPLVGQLLEIIKDAKAQEPLPAIKEILIKSENLANISKNDETESFSLNTVDEEGTCLLTHAVQKGNFEVVELLLQHKASPTYIAPKSTPPINAAAYDGKAEITKLLLSHGADPNKVNPVTGNTPLIAAKNKEMIQILLNAKANLDGVNAKDGNTALNAAVYYDKDEEVIEFLLVSKANPNIANKDIKSPLTMAIKLNKYNCVKMLIEAKANIEFKDKYGRRPLANAVRYNDLHLDSKIFNLLLESKADPQYIDNEGFTALSIAVARGYLDQVKILLQPQYTPRYYLGDKSLLTIAVCEFETNVVSTLNDNRMIIARLLLDNGIDPNYGGDEEIETPMHSACFGGKAEMVKILVEYKVEINRVFEDKSTPLALAAQKGHLDVVKVLLDNKANCNMIEGTNNTPLYHAIIYDREQIVKTLIERSGNVNLSFGDLNLTVLEYIMIEKENFFSEYKKLKYTQILLSMGANIRNAYSLFRMLMSCDLRHPDALTCLILFCQIQNQIIEKPQNSQPQKLSDDYAEAANNCLQNLKIIYSRRCGFFTKPYIDAGTNLSLPVELVNLAAQYLEGDISNLPNVMSDLPSFDSRNIDQIVKMTQVEDQVTKVPSKKMT